MMNSQFVLVSDDLQLTYNMSSSNILLQFLDISAECVFFFNAQRREKVKFWA